MKKNIVFSTAKSKVLSMDKLNLHDKFTKENFLNLCSLRWSEWGRWRRFFVIAGAIAAIVVSAPSFVMILPCVTVFYLISCTIKNAVEIISNWKWGPIFPKKRIKQDDILSEFDEKKEGVRSVLGEQTPIKKINQLKEKEVEDNFLESLESINGEEEETLEEIELPAEEYDEDPSFETESLEEEIMIEEEEGEKEESEEIVGEDVFLDKEVNQISKNTREAN